MIRGALLLLTNIHSVVSSSHSRFSNYLDVRINGNRNADNTVTLRAVSLFTPPKASQLHEPPKFVAQYVEVPRHTCMKTLFGTEPLVGFNA